MSQVQHNNTLKHETVYKENAFVLKHSNSPKYFWIFLKILPRTYFYFIFQGQCDVTPEGYHHLTKLLMNLARGKIVVVLEVTAQDRKFCHFCTAI